MPDTPQADLQKKIRELPHKPGVYIFRDRINRIIYVGKARDLHRRVSQYFHPSRRGASDPKTKALVDGVRDLEYHTVRSEPEALLLEGKLIKEHRPKYNILFKDDKRFPLVRVHLGDLFPKFMITRLKREDGARYFGPFVNSNALRSTLQILRKKFGIRSCYPTEPGERDYKHCLDHIIKNCSAPCVGTISREDYLAKVSEACEFLEGRARELADQLETDMREAAERFDFENAARLRDMISDLRTTAQPTRSFARTTPSTVVPDEDMESLREVLNLPTLPRRIECFDISNISSTYSVASMVAFSGGRPDRAHYRRFRIRSVQGQNDFASMREAVFRRYRRVLGLPDPTSHTVQDSPPPNRERLPDLVVVDGGRGQIGSALEAFHALGVTPPPIIGLAKEREEIYYPDSLYPLSIPHTSGAIRLLQRIRDEAHRTANGFHQILLKRRMSESLLDDIPGISSARKLALLERFGSVHRIKKTPSETLASLPGISLTLANKILRHLHQIPAGSDLEIPADREPFLEQK